LILLLFSKLAIHHIYGAFLLNSFSTTYFTLAAKTNNWQQVELKTAKPMNAQTEKTVAKNCSSDSKIILSALK